MAKSHAPLFRSKTLCGAFLSAAMALAGCANSPPPPPGPVNPAQPRLDPVTVPNTARSFESIPFREIDHRGDPRLKGIIAKLRQSPLGEEMYQYAVGKDLEFQWEFGRKDRKGAYYFSEKRIAVDVIHTDDGVLTTLAHEIRHAYQDNTMNIASWKLDPQGKWQAWQFMEADSCAFSTYFIAEHQRTTGQSLNLDAAFNSDVTKNYTKKDAGTQDYVKDALEPCFALVVKYYRSEHLGVLHDYQKRYRDSFNDAVASGDYKRALDYNFTPSTPEYKTALFLQFMNLTLSPKNALPQTNPSDFMKWMEQQSSYKVPEDEAEISSIQNEFYDMRQRIMNNLQYKKN